MRKQIEILRLKLNNKKVLVVFGVILILLIIVIFIYTTNNKESTFIEGSGIVEGNAVVISSKLSGQIEHLSVQEGDQVKKGQIIAKLAAKQIEAKVKQAQAQLELAQAEVRTAQIALETADIQAEQAKLGVKLTREDVQSQIIQAEAGLELAVSNLEQARITHADLQKDYTRLLELYKVGAVSSQKLEKSKIAIDVAKEKLRVAENRVEQAKAILNLAKSLEINTEVNEMSSEVAQKQLQGASIALNAAQARKKLAAAALEEALATLKDTEIRAPIEGTITLKLVNQGELVNPGSPIVEMIDLSNLDLTIYVPEIEMGKLTLGQEAQVFIDTYKDKPFKGKVVYISDKAEFTPKNVHMKEDRVKLVYGVKIQLQNTKGIIKPGMPAEAIIKIK